MKTRTYRRIRSIILLLLIVFIVTTFINNFTTDKESYTSEYVYTVVPGDTLWDIAKEYNYNNEDVREIVYNIQKHNNISNSQIYSGQVLKIPVTLTIQENKSVEVVFNN